MVVEVELDDATGVVLSFGSTDRGVDVAYDSDRGCGGGINDEAVVEFDGGCRTGVGAGDSGTGGTCGAGVVSVVASSAAGTGTSLVAG